MIRLSRARSLAALLVAALAACGGGRASTGPLPVPVPNAPPPVAPAPAAAAPAPAPRAFAYTPGSYRYEVRSEAVTTALDGDRRADTTTTRMILGFRIEPGTTGQLRVVGTVDSFTVRGGGGAVPTITPFPFELEISSSGEILTPATDSAGACATPTSVPLTLAREVIVAVPVVLAPGAAWEDSVRVTTCRAMLPVTTRSVRQSRAEWVGVPPELARRSGDAAYRVVRSVSTTVSGDARAAGRQVMISGAGEGTSAFFLDPLGVVIGATGDVSSQLIVDSGTQRQQFAQVVRHYITLRR